MFKVGDEVLIKAEVKDDDGHGKKQIKIKGIDGYSHLWIDVYELIPAIKTYKQGLADAWELARKIEAIEPDEREKMFSYCSVKAIIEDCTIEEVMDKIEAYEKKKEIKVNDIVKVKGERGLGIVTTVCPTGIVYVLWNDGGCSDYEPCELEKTGRTAEGLEVLLRQIAE